MCFFWRGTFHDPYYISASLKGCRREAEPAGVDINNLQVSRRIIAVREARGHTSK